jgi:hypothetical protein
MTPHGAPVPPEAVGRLDGGFDLVGTRVPECRRGFELAVGLVHGLVVPRGDVLLAQRHEASAGIAAGRPAGMAVPQQREQPAGLRGVRHQGDQERRQPDGLVCQVHPALRAVHDFRPGDAEGGVDRVEDVSQSLRQLLRLGDDERNARGRDLGLGPHQSLAHRGGRHEEGGGQPGRVQAEHDLQHERRTDTRLDGGVGADEQQLQPLVGERVIRRRGRQRLQMRDDGLGLRADALSTMTADEGAPRRRQQPRIGRRGHAARRPGAHGGVERVGQGIFGRGDVARPRSEVRQQPPV